MSSGDISSAATIEWGARALMQVAQLAFATYVADKQFDLAQQYSDRAQGIFDKQMELATSDNARWAASGGPCLDGFLSEVCGHPVYVENYLEEAAKTMTTVRQAGSIAAKKVFECADVYCIGMSQHAINEIAFKEAALSTSAVHFAFRREEVDVERKNQLRLANKAQGISLSRNAYNGSSAGLGAIGAQYAAMAQKAGEGLTSSLQSIGFNGQQLGQSLLNNPFMSRRNDPTSVGVRTEAQAAQGASAFQNSIAQYATTSPAVGAAVNNSWGTDPMQGARGPNGSEDPGGYGKTSDEPGYWQEQIGT
jgi:hypothetical protein